MIYRPDIDGLRALAVLLVVAFHIQLPGFAAGFIGVDIFFVISGFLITSLLYRELASTGRIDLPAFYARRIRRLAPAILFVLTAVMFASLFLLHPFGQQQDLFKSAVAASVFLANIYFSRTTGGYFDTPMDEVPLLHFWSLSVEEQFYICWPLLLLVIGSSWLARRFGTLRTLLGFTVGLSLLSWAWSLKLVQANDHAAYFLMPTRAWQLLCGATLALLVLRQRRNLRRVAATLAQVSAVLLLFAALWLIDGPANHPGLTALLPTLAAALLILGGATGNASLTRFFAAAPVVRLGKLSFSWYLWHWPVIALARAQSLAGRSLIVDLCAALLALGLAALTFRFVEERFRRAGTTSLHSTGIIARGLAATLVTALLAGGLGLFARHANLTQPWWFADPRLESARFARNELWDHCHLDAPFRGLPTRRACVSGTADAPVRAVVFGDSHADHLAPLNHAYGTAMELGILQRSFSACRPIFGVYAYLPADVRAHCRAFHQQVLDEARELSAVGLRGVILSGYYWGEFDMINPPGGGLRFSRAVAATTKEFTDLGLRVLLIAPIPVMRFDAVQCVARRPDRECGLARSDWESKRLRAMRALLAVVDANPRVQIFDPTQVLCDDVQCAVGDEQMLYYRDNNHLTPEAAVALLPSIGPALNWVTGRTDSPPPEISAQSAAHTDAN